MTQSLFDQVADELVKAFQVDREDITPDSTLEELGLDSLALMELTVRFEDQTGLELPDTEDARLGTRSTLADITAVLGTVLPSGASGSPIFPHQTQPEGTS
ncbi:acyl carrier protein [Streptomyces sp. ISL-11]|uniref:acyl carrier protein n=1 Tax=Streptomyces sp. ISL-11 TaxID=2819174 RepID=UPI001BE758D3|nr:acyl carrier protein [Streptomyces sp. ISL-11]MBT2386622.1 acyl carrier protein [Streptomyces sp. ISL-11]